MCKIPDLPLVHISGPHPIPSLHRCHLGLWGPVGGHLEGAAHFLCPTLFPSIHCAGFEALPLLLLTLAGLGGLQVSSWRLAAPGVGEAVRTGKGWDQAWCGWPSAVPLGSLRLALSPALGPKTDPGGRRATAWQVRAAGTPLLGGGQVKARGAGRAADNSCGAGRKLGGSRFPTVECHLRQARVRPLTLPSRSLSSRCRVYLPCIRAPKLSFIPSSLRLRSFLQ